MASTIRNTRNSRINHSEVSEPLDLDQSLATEPNVDLGWLRRFEKEVNKCIADGWPDVGIECRAPTGRVNVSDLTIGWNMVLDKMATISDDGHMAKQQSPKVSDQLRRIIADCGLSRYEISKRTGIDEATLSRFMYGERGLSMKALDRLGDSLGLTVKMRQKPEQQGKRVS
jgi:hypothetical protein